MSNGNGYSLEKTYSLPGYWRGAAHARDELGDTIGALRARRVEEQLRDRRPLRLIPEWHQWRLSVSTWQ